MANVNYYSKDWLNRAVDNELEYLLRGYTDYLAGSDLALSRSEVMRVFLQRLLKKSKRAASQEPINLKARLGQTGDLKDLEIGYWKAEDAARDASKKVARSAASAPARYIKDDRNFWNTLGGFIRETAGKEIAELRARVAELEERPAGLDYKGVWKSGGSYSKNMGVSHGGSIWVARKDYPEGVPGEKRGHWQLAVKRGSHGKDATNE
jgi:hypothetical protein